MFTPRVLEILCAGAVNGDGQVALVYANVIGGITLVKQNNENTHFDSKMSQACVLPGGLLDAYWMFTVEEDMSSCPRRRACLLVQPEDMSSCPTDMPSCYKKALSSFL